MQDFWSTRGHLSEGRERLGALLAHPGGQERTKARARSLNGAGNLAWMQGDYDEARVLFDESLTIGRGSGDKKGIADSLNNLGIVAWMQGDYVTARILFEESLTIKRELGYKNGIADSLGNLGNVAMVQGDYVQAQVLLEEGLTIRRELGDKWGMANSFVNLGNAAMEQGDYLTAHACLREGLTLCRELGDKYSTSYVLEGCAALAHRQQQPTQAVSLWSAAAALRETIGCPLSPVEHEKQEREMTAARDALGEDAFALAWAQGQAMTLEQAIEQALNEKV